jgi:hypothetical protein
MGGQIKFDTRQIRRWLCNSGMALRIWLTKAVLWVGAVYRFKSSFMNVLLVCLGYGFIVVACAHEDDSLSDHAQHRQHHGGNYRDGENSDRSDASQSATPIPGL